MKTFWALAIMFLLHDTCYYCLHCACHTSKWLYRTVHALHHDPAYALEARTGLVMTCAESLLLHGVPYALATVSSSHLLTSTQSGVQTVNVWVVSAFIIASAQLGMIGHSGLKFKSHLPLFWFNPLLAALLLPGTFQNGADHQIHHEQPGYNMALYFRHWDDWFGTTAPSKKHCRANSSLLLMAYNLVYYASISLAFAHSQWIIAAVSTRIGLAVCFCCIVMPLPCAWDWFRRLPVWDTVRSAYACSVSCQEPLDPSQRYLFGYHPHGVFARGLWLVFAFQGRQSPVSGLR